MTYLGDASRTPFLEAISSTRSDNWVLRAMLWSSFQRCIYILKMIWSTFMGLEPAILGTKLIIHLTSLYTHATRFFYFFLVSALVGEMLLFHGLKCSFHYVKNWVIQLGSCHRTSSSKGTSGSLSNWMCEALLVKLCSFSLCSYTPPRMAVSLSWTVLYRVSSMLFDFWNHLVAYYSVHWCLLLAKDQPLKLELPKGSL